MLLLVFYDVRSERELMDTLPERLEWLWFLGYDLDSEIPDHSVLSKARKRWGPEVFQSFFERIVLQCVEAGLVDGKKIFLDASLVDADASNSSVIDLWQIWVRLDLLTCLTTGGWLHSVHNKSFRMFNLSSLTPRSFYDDLVREMERQLATAPADATLVRMWLSASRALIATEPKKRP